MRSGALFSLRRSLGFGLDGIWRRSTGDYRDSRCYRLKFGGRFVSFSWVITLTIFSRHFFHPLRTLYMYRYYNDTTVLYVLFYIFFDATWSSL